MRGKETGRVVPLMISAQSTPAREAGGYLLDLIGLVFAVPGVLFGYIAVTAYPVAHDVVHGHRHDFVSWRTRLVHVHSERTAAVDRGMEKASRHRPGDARSEQREADRDDHFGARGCAAQLKQTKSYRMIVPILAAVAVLLFVIGVFQSVKISRLETRACARKGRWCA